MGQRIVITTFGSFGDLHPYLALSLELQRRGHTVTIATCEYYRQKILAEGIGFAPVRPDLPPEDSQLAQYFMDAQQGTQRLLQEFIFPVLRQSYEDLLAIVQSADLLITHPVTYAGPLVAQKTGIVWVSTVLAPTSFFSAYDPPVLAPYPWLAQLRPLGPLVNGSLLQLGKLTTQIWSEPVRKLRADLGLPTGSDPIFEGQHSPQLVLAMFSACLAVPQPDWPPQTRVTGFAFYDRLDKGLGVSAQLSVFLASGEPPLVFTLGTAAVMTAGNFYTESIQLTQKLGQRAVLLVGKDLRNLPEQPLPPEIIAVDYAPFSELFPQAQVIIHQGGIGTTGQALRSGRPMLVVPFSHDQPDNASRLVRLGVARTITRDQYNTRQATSELQQLLTDPMYRQRAAHIGRQIQAEDGVKAACDAIEQQF